MEGMPARRAKFQHRASRQAGEPLTSWMLGLPSTYSSQPGMCMPCHRIQWSSESRCAADRVRVHGVKMGQESSKGQERDYLIKPPDAGARFADRRSVPRYPFIAAAEIFEPVSQTAFQGRTAEIGAKGCYVDMVNPLEVNSVFRLRIHREGSTFETWGRAVYAQAGLGMGVFFLKTQPDQQSIIESWIKELAAAPTPAPTHV